jgi:transposase-like protein
VEDVARALGIEALSKSQVSEMARSLDAMVEAFRNEVERL